MPRSHPAVPLPEPPPSRPASGGVFLDAAHGRARSYGYARAVLRGPARLEPAPVQPCDGSVRRPDVSPPSPLESPAEAPYAAVRVRAMRVFFLVSRTPALAHPRPSYLRPAIAGAARNWVEVTAGSLRSPRLQRRASGRRGAVRLLSELRARNMNRPRARVSWSPETVLSPR